MWFNMKSIETISFFNFNFFFFLSTAALWLSIIFANIYDHGVKNPHVMLLLIQLARPEGFMQTEKTD